MSQGPLCPNLSQIVQKEVSQMANRNLSRVILLGGLSVNLNHLKTGLATVRMAMGSGSHRPLLFWQWPELKLRWWTQTLPRLYRIHLIHTGQTMKEAEKWVVWYCVKATSLYLNRYWGWDLLSPLVWSQSSSLIHSSVQCEYTSGCHSFKLHVCPSVVGGIIKCNSCFSTLPFTF